MSSCVCVVLCWTNSIKIGKWYFTHNYLVSGWSEASLACRAHRTPHPRTILQIHLAWRPSAAICFASVHRYRSDGFHLADAKQKRDVSWENSCHQFLDSTHQHQNRKHQIGSWWCGGGEKFLFLFLFYWRNRNTKDELLQKNCWIHFETVFYSTSTFVKV